jgi:O-antigen ligase
MRLFVPGMWLGLAGVIAVGLWERWSFASVLDLTVPYRITATFSSMHTGGSEIETYLVMALPFTWLAFGREWPAGVRFAGLALLALGAYLVTLTVARGGILAFGVVLGVLLLSAYRTPLPEAKGRWLATLATVAFFGGAAVLTVGLTGGYLQKRLAHTEEDFAVRMSHWKTALAIRDEGVTATLFGTGLGRFPEAYLFRSGAASMPGTYAFVEEDRNRFLRLGGGETLYMAQRTAVEGGHRYTLSLRARSNAKASLGLPLCEKHLLNSARCQWQVLPVPGDGEWHAKSIAVDTGPVGGGSWLTRRPVELSLYNQSEGTVIDVDDVQLQDEAGKPLVRNGDFSAGGDYWFFKTHSHLPWHIKNLWVEVLFEQGWFGLTSFLFLLAVLVAHLARAVWRGDRIAGALFAATAGFITVGMFGSLFDSPRIATLFFFLVALAGIIVSDGRDRRRARSVATDPGMRQIALQ